MLFSSSRVRIPQHRWRRPLHQRQQGAPAFDTRKLFDAVFPGSRQIPISSSELFTWEKFLEQQIKVLWKGYFIPVLPLLGYTAGSIEDAFEILPEISALLQVAPSSEISIDSISLKLFENHQIDQMEVRNAGRHEVRQLIFAAVGLLTMLYTPSPTVTNGSFTITLPTESNSVSRQQSCEKAQNQLFRFLRGFGDLVPVSTHAEDHNYEGDDPELSVSKLNYSTLRNIGNIHISWVDNLGSHLHFNEKTHVLSLFRLPSFCLLQRSISDNASLFHQAIQSLCPKRGDLPEETQVSETFLIEVFLSYRILFGFDKTGRRMFKSEQRKLVHSLGMSDPLLEQLCGKARVEERLDLGSQVCPGGIYTKYQNFPIFGDRLMALQSYSTRQTPNKFWAFWRDRRKPADFLNLWVVVFFGAISLILSLFQLIVAMIALVVSFRQLQQG